MLSILLVIQSDQSVSDTDFLSYKMKKNIIHKHIQIAD